MHGLSTDFKEGFSNAYMAGSVFDIYAWLRAVSEVNNIPSWRTLLSWQEWSWKILGGWKGGGGGMAVPFRLRLSTTTKSYETKTFF